MWSSPVPHCTQTDRNAIILGGNKNPKSLLPAETHAQFCWFELHPHQDLGILCQYHRVAQLHRLLGFLQLQSNIYFHSHPPPFSCSGHTAPLFIFFFHLQSSTPHIFTKGSIQNGNFKKKFITSVNQQIVFISNKATLSFFSFHLDLAVLNSTTNGTIKCRMKMKWKSWDVIWGLFKYHVLSALLLKLQPICVIYALHFHLS